MQSDRLVGYSKMMHLYYHQMIGNNGLDEF